MGKKSEGPPETPGGPQQALNSLKKGVENLTQMGALEKIKGLKRGFKLRPKPLEGLPW